MTTYTTPHFATGLPDRNVRPEPVNRARPATAAPYRTAGISDEAAVMADGQTPDWQPGGSKGVPKAAIGALGAALVGGVALAIVLMAPSSKVTKQVTLPDPIAQAATANAATQKSNDATDAAVAAMDKQAPAAGNADAAAPAPVQAVIPNAPPVVNAPVARLPKHTVAPVAAPKVAPHPVQSAPVATPDAVTPPADVQPPAMQQTPDTLTVTPSVPTPVPASPAQDIPAPVPAPAQ